MVILDSHSFLQFMPRIKLKYMYVIRLIYVYDMQLMLRLMLSYYVNTYDMQLCKNICFKQIYVCLSLYTQAKRQFVLM